MLVLEHINRYEQVFHKFYFKHRVNKNILYYIIILIFANQF